MQRAMGASFSAPPEFPIEGGPAYGSLGDMGGDVECKTPTYDETGPPPPPPLPPTPRPNPVIGNPKRKTVPSSAAGKAP